MDTEAMRVVLHHSEARGTDKVVLLALTAWDGDVDPTVAELAAQANVNVRGVQKSLRRLREIGELRTFAQEGGDFWTPKAYWPNAYEVLVTCPESCSLDHAGEA